MTRIIHSAILTLLLAACNTQTTTVPGALPTPGDTAFTVNGHVVTQDMVDATLRRLPDEMREQIEQKNQMDQVYQDIALSELLYQKALEQKLQDDAKVKIDMAMAQRSALASQLVKDTVEKRLTDERIQKWYDDHLVQYNNEQAFVRLIVAEDMDAAKAIKTEAEGGADFAELARTKSKDPRSAPEGGELGWMSKKDMPRDMANAIFGADKGTIVEPIQTPSGVLLFKVEDLRKSTPFEEVKDDIKSKAEQEVMDEFIKEIRDEVNIVKPGDAPKAEVTPPAPGAAAPAANKPAADKPAADKPAADEPAADKPAAPAEHK